MPTRSFLQPTAPPGQAPRVAPVARVGLPFARLIRVARSARAAVLPLAVCALAGCVVAPAPRPVVYRPAPPAPAPVYDNDVLVDVAPPPPYAEVVPALPFAGAVWIGGYWGWGGGRHHWVPGHYEQPRPGYAWRPHAWEQRGGRWHLHEGGWVRR